MEILVAQHLGICFGVRDAIAQAETLAAQGPLTILGELVHNPIVREQLRARGIKEGSLDRSSPEENARVMITAHGASDRARARWSAQPVAVADATCPLVRHAHAQLRTLVQAGYFPVVIGQAGHVEVRGLTEDFPAAFIIGTTEEVQRLPIASRYGVISQTTQPIYKVHELVRQIKQARLQSEVRFIDTVCKPTKDRQHALEDLISQAELIVVVGGLTSNNTLQLVERCRAAGRRCLHIERPEQIIESDFAGVALVGVTAGTSTLPETIEAVVARLRALAGMTQS